MIWICPNGLFLNIFARVINGFIDPASFEATTCVEALCLGDDLGDPCHISSFEEAKFIHYYRESNYEEHALARVATDLPVGRHCWLLETLKLVCILAFSRHLRPS